MLDTYVTLNTKFKRKYAVQSALPRCVRVGSGGMRGEKTDITQKGFTQAAGGILDLTEATCVTSLTVTWSIDPQGDQVRIWENYMNGFLKRKPNSISFALVFFCDRVEPVPRGSCTLATF